MLNNTVFLTLATLAGLILGFAREWLLVADWGAGARTDAYLVALFLPEALRTMLAGGLLSAAALPLWQAQPASAQPYWLAGQVRHFLWLALALALGITLGAPYLVKIIGLGLSAADALQATQSLRCLAWVIPGLFLQAVFTIPMQANSRFVLPGLGSFLFNLPVVIYLGLAKQAADPLTLAQCFILGSLLMLLPLLPPVWRMGWRPWYAAPRGQTISVWRQLWPLLSSSVASQGLTLLERLVASFLGDGSITLLNLARKLVNIPLIALMSLNQVLLGKMSGEGRMGRRKMLDTGLLLCTLLTLPAAVGLIATAPALVGLLLPHGLAQGPLPVLLALFAVSIVFGAWNALLARYYYAAADTRTPLICELSGSAVQSALLLGLPCFLGIWGMACAVMGGVLSTAWMLCRNINPALLRDILKWAALALLLCALAAFAWAVQGRMAQLAVGAFSALLLFVSGAYHLKKKLGKTGV
ncbi:murein biosynthesis integral membrane protein MurJ [Iodobacter sp. HSC-16F04]|uniref:Murein biosynthesis integral membrane protein MurJ n=1 Tax=Iodobacter violaceini TaxID=3044271 RepID=A0ABX0KWY0_9NEIS|nr:lipid II flippase MurJ [Iodobacter violacea]NHQ86549.1 murein biosynthesis integral membrane protein MurJ [Iodobacter violacea]